MFIPKKHPAHLVRALDAEAGAVIGAQASVKECQQQVAVAD